VRLVDLGDKKSATWITPRAGTGLVIAFTRDDKYLVTANSKAVQMWNVTADPISEISRMLLNGESDVEPSDSALSPNGEYVATVSVDKASDKSSVRYITEVWRWQPEDLMTEVCHRLSRNLTDDEWKIELSTEPFCKVCSELPGSGASCRYSSKVH
jgi:hypothetical protein